MAAGPVLQRSMSDLDAWFAGMPREEIIEPSLPIVDAHHHMWWRPPEAYQFAELMADTGSGHDIRATVFVQCTAMYRAGGPEWLRPVGETDYVNGVAAISASGGFGDTRLCAGIVGWADLRMGDEVVALLDAHVAAGSGRFRGIRQQAQHDPHLGSMARISPPAGLLNDPAFQRGFAHLAPRHLSFDAWVYFTQLHEVAALAAAFPEMSIVLNHIGAPLGIGHYADRRAEVFDTWSAGIRALAREPNVTCKLGGLGMTAYGFGFADRVTPAGSVELADAWRPYIAVCIDAFGPDRCMFESNFPVDKQACSYATLWNAFKRIADGYTPGERTAMFSQTATRVYRL